MKKWKGCGLAVILIALINSADAQPLRLLRHRHFSNYSSASAMAWHKGRLYVMGDDAPELLVLNKRLKEKARIKLFDDKTQRIPSAQKHDIESAFIWQTKDDKRLVLVPSFSAPVRNKITWLSLSNGQPSPQTIIDTLAGLSFNGLNIEGSTAFGEGVLLAQRSLNSPSNHTLYLYSFDKEEGLQHLVRTISIKLPSASVVIGISGLCYAPKQNVLFLTFSSEATTDPTKDGIVGDSYLGWIENWSRISEQKTVAVKHLINLTPLLKSKELQKIESVTVQKERRDKIMLHLAADNDNGTSDIFTLSVRLPR